MTVDGSSSSTIRVDVAVVGGGVAGSALAGALAAAGLGVAIVEREPAFKDRIRGEALHPWGAAEADRLGLVPTLRAAGAQPLPIWQRYAGRLPAPPYRWSDDVPAGHVEWGVPHPALQRALLAEAAARGVRVLRPASATGYRSLPGAGAELDVVGADAKTTIRTRLVVGADGGRSATRRWIGGTTRSDPVHHAIGGCLLDGVALDETSSHQAYPPGSMVTVFPQGDGRVRAYLVCDPSRAAAFRGPGADKAFVAACAADLPAGALAEATPAGPVGFFPGIDVWSDVVAADGLVLVGDAAGANDPSQGHGLSLAFRDARELRDLLLDGADWSVAIAAFAARRVGYVAPLRAHARWAGVLTTERGEEADARRERVARARETDPGAGGFAGIYAFGPDGLVADEAARRRFFGEEPATTSVAAR